MNVRERQQRLIQNELIEATKEGNINKVTALLRENPTIDINYRDKKQWGLAALHYAARNGHLNMCQLLLSGRNIDVKSRDKDGNTIFHHAAKNGHLDICQLLISNPNVDINIQSNNGTTALYDAVSREHLDICQLLILDPNIDINIKNKSHRTALQLAVDKFYPNHPIVNILSKESLWQFRRAYLSLVEGCCSDRKYIARYLFDDMICREICSYLGV